MWPTAVALHYGIEIIASQAEVIQFEPYYIQNSLTGVHDHSVSPLSSKLDSQITLHKIVLAWPAVRFVARSVPE
jgi:hypothetical protein